MIGRRAALAGAIGALLAFTAAAAGGQEVEHSIVVPNPDARISSVFPLVGEFIPNGQYEQWWHEIAACEGLQLPVDHLRVRFYQVNAVHFYDQLHPSLYWQHDTLMVRWAVAQTFTREPSIFVALVHMFERLVIEHEMLHLLLYWNGIPPGPDLHPQPYFSRCGMTVRYAKARANVGVLSRDTLGRASSPEPAAPADTNPTDRAAASHQ